MTKDNARRIQWFLDLIDHDYKKNGYGNELKLMAETYMMVHFGHTNIPRPRTHRITWQNDEMYEEDYFSEDVLEWLKGQAYYNCVKRLRDFFLNLMKSKEAILKYSEDWDSEYRRQDCLADINIHINTRIEVPIPDPKIKTINKGQDKQQTMFKLPLNNYLKTPIKIATKATSDEETLLFHFCQSIDGIPIGAFRQCPECDKYYIHISKRKRIFCSPKCAMRDTNRKKRSKIKKTDPNAYAIELKEGSKRARKSYVKKVKKEHPKAKPDRRPYKHKD